MSDTVTFGMRSLDTEPTFLLQLNYNCISKFKNLSNFDVKKKKIVDLHF